MKKTKKTVKSHIDQQKNYKIYTDGACEPNPGVGGYCSVIFGADDIKPMLVIRGGHKDTTNNRMEIMGVLCALRYLTETSNITFFSDSQYVCNSLNTWLYKWKAKNKVMKNMDLWNEIWELRNKHKFKAIWIKGHNGNFYNEFTDMQSLEAIDKTNSIKRMFFEEIKYFDK